MVKALTRGGDPKAYKIEQIHEQFRPLIETLDSQFSIRVDDLPIEIPYINFDIPKFDKSIDELHIKNITLVHDFDEFSNASDLIIANRLDNQIKPFSGKIFSRDIFSSDE